LTIETREQSSVLTWIPSF